MPEPETPMTKWGLRLAAAVALGAVAVLASSGDLDAGSREQAVAAVIDDWHAAAAAAAADEERYFGHMPQDAVFLGTDPAERWTVAQFRAYAYPPSPKERRGAFGRSVGR